MAIIGSVFALLGRFAGRLLNSALGWATLLLFGKVDGRRQTLLLIVASASLVWVLVLIGIVVPDAGTFLLAFVPVPAFVDENAVRLVMLGLAALIPLLIGLAAVFVAQKSERAMGFGFVAGILRGYPFTLVLALTILVLAVVSLIRKIRSLSKRWEDAHVPVIVKPGGYDRVLVDLERVLNAVDLDVHQQPAPAVLSIPPRLLDAVAGKALGGLVPDRLMVLAGRELEVLVYPSDVAIAGAKQAMARARAAIASQLTDSPAYLTTSAESERIEDEIKSVAKSERTGSAGTRALQERLRDLDRRIAQLAVPFDEWETVFRQRLQIERDLLADQPDPLRQMSAQPAEGPSGSLGGRLVALVGLGLIVLDVALQVADRHASRSKR